MGDIVKGAKKVLSVEGVGMVAAIVVALAVLYAFAPAFTPQGLATRIKG